MWTRGLVYFSLSMLVLTACAPKTLEGNAEELDRIRTKGLVDVLDSLSQSNIDFFYSKISTHYKDSSRNVSFKTSLRMKRDSALSTLIKFAAIPIVQTLITQDSLIIANKREKCFTRAELAYLREQYGVDFTLANIEELLLGLPLDFDRSQKYYQLDDNNYYVLSSHKKRQIRHLDRRAEEDEIIFKYLISPEPHELKGLEIISAADSTSIVIRYLSRELIDGQSVPQNIEIEVHSPTNNLLVELEYTKSEINNPEPLYFIIPDSYDECQ